MNAEAYVHSTAMRMQRVLDCPRGHNPVPGGMQVTKELSGSVSQQAIYHRGESRK